MAIYTVTGSDELDQKIEADLKRIKVLAAPHCLAGILLGGYGRGEGTPFINPDHSQAPFNDYDLVVIVDQPNHPLQERLKTLEDKLSAELQLPVDLYPYRKAQLPSCEFSLLNYEMKHGHKVIWGDPDILKAMPDYPHNAIPDTEGLRLLLNRGKLLFDIKQRLSAPDSLSDLERLRFLKFITKTWLALGDCALLAERNYTISYQVKRRQISSIGNIPNRSIVIEQYVKAIELKEQGDYLARLAGTNLTEEFQWVRDLFLTFFHWYKAQSCSREGTPLKNMLLNLKWNHAPYLAHPRQRLYEALPELLQDHPDRRLLEQILCCRKNVEARFYALQKRFS
jgi:hypothetical protein